MDEALPPLPRPPLGVEQYLPEYAWSLVSDLGKRELSNRIAGAVQALRRAAQTAEQWSGVVALTEQVYVAQEAAQRATVPSGEPITLYRDFSDAPAKAMLYEAEEAEVQRALSLFALCVLYSYKKEQDVQLQHDTDTIG